MKVINHNINAGQKLIVKVNDVERVNVTIPEKKLLHIMATEVYVFMPGDVIEVDAGGRHWSYTVPQGKALLVSEELIQEPMSDTATAKDS